MRIFETYNPGAVVRILSYGYGKWEIIFDGDPEMVEKKAREFRPRINKINVPTR